MCHLPNHKRVGSQRDYRASTDQKKGAILSAATPPPESELLYVQSQHLGKQKHDRLPDFIFTHVDVGAHIKR